MTESALYELVEQIRQKRDEFEALSEAAKAAERGSPRHADLARRRMEAEEELGHLVFEYLEGEDDTFVPYSERVDEDLGVLSSVAQMFVRVRAELEKELARDDLTPYIWSVLSTRVEAINLTLGVVGGKKSRNIPLESVPTHVLYAEFDDGSIDFSEADDEAEAAAIEQGFVDDGAVVYRYRVMPELGQRYPLTEPITPMTNRHRPMTRNKFQRIVRLKGGEDKFRLPEEIRDAILLPYDTYHERHDNDTGRPEVIPPFSMGASEPDPAARGGEVVTVPHQSKKLGKVGGTRPNSGPKKKMSEASKVLFMADAEVAERFYTIADRAIRAVQQANASLPTRDHDGGISRSEVVRAAITAFFADRSRIGQTDLLDSLRPYHGRAKPRLDDEPAERPESTRMNTFIDVALHDRINQLVEQMNASLERENAGLNRQFDRDSRIAASEVFRLAVEEFVDAYHRRGEQLALDLRPLLGKSKRT